MSTDFNTAVIEEFRANQGRVGGMFEGARLLLLTTIGRRSGAPHTVPLGYLPDGDRWLVIASAAGAPTHPAWYHNLVANPRVTVEDGIFTYDADAVVLDGAERDRLFARAVEADPGWGEYQAKTTRTIPVVALHLLDGTPNATAWGDGLVQIHAAFRRELALIRQELTAAGSRLGAQLRVNCLTVCEGLHFHHRMEDDQMFASLEEQQPELADALIQLRQEHASIQRLLEELQAVVSVDGQDTATVRAEVERLTTAVEAHLDHEEEHLVPVLNALAAHSAR